MKDIVIESIETGENPNTILARRLRKLREKEAKAEEEEVAQQAEEEKMRKCLW